MLGVKKTLREASIYRSEKGLMNEAPSLFDLVLTVDGGWMSIYAWIVPVVGYLSLR